MTVQAVLRLGRAAVSAVIALGLGACTVPEESTRGVPEEFARTTPERASELGCLSCHEGIEAIREETSAMLASIRGMGTAHGDPEGCVVCHGGNPAATTFEDAHRGTPETMPPNGPDAFYPDPGSIWVADRSCGQCHSGYVYNLERSLMNTEAGKIQGNLHTWGINEVQNYKVPWGNYDVPTKTVPRPAWEPTPTRPTWRG